MQYFTHQYGFGQFQHGITKQGLLVTERVVSLISEKLANYRGFH
jgi:hypothetical protein